MNASEIWTAYTQSPTYAKGTSQRRKEQVETIYGQFAEYANDENVTPTMIYQWLVKRTATCSPKTYDEYLRIVRQVLKATMSVNGLSTNPALEVPVKHKRSVSRKPYTREQVNAVVQTAMKGKCTIPYSYKTHGKTVVVDRPYDIPYGKEVALTVLLGAYCGMRLGDAVSVTKDHYNDGFLAYTPSKTQVTSGAEVVVPVLHDALRDALERTRGALTPHLGEWHRRNPSTLCRLYKRVFEACGLETQTERDGMRKASTGGFHALRHSYVTWSAEAGVPIDVVSSCVGHTSTLTTSIYNHVSRQRKAQEMRKIMAGS